MLKWNSIRNAEVVMDITNLSIGWKQYIFMIDHSRYWIKEIKRVKPKRFYDQSNGALWIRIEKISSVLMQMRAGRGILAPLSIIFIVVFVIQSTLFERTQIWREIEGKKLAKRKSTERAGTGKEKRENGMNESMKLIVCPKKEWWRTASSRQTTLVMLLLFIAKLSSIDRINFPSFHSSTLRLQFKTREWLNKAIGRNLKIDLWTL